MDHFRNHHFALFKEKSIFPHIKKKYLQEMENIYRIIHVAVKKIQLRT